MTDQTTKQTPSFAISITEGRTVRDLFYNGFLEGFRDSGIPVTVFTQAYRVDEFTNEWSGGGISFAPLQLTEHTAWRSRAYRVRRRLAQLGVRPLLNSWLSFESRALYSVRQDHCQTFRQSNVRLLLTTHAHFSGEGELIRSAHACGIPTVGMVRSWDNVHKGIKTRPRQVVVWNEINRQEVIQLEGYAPRNVHVLGSPQFDAYFQQDRLWSRSKLAAHFGLDSNRPIILFATLGNFNPSFDETCWMSVLLRAIEDGQIEGQPQVICRLHPWSRLEQFQKFESHSDVRLSYVGRYWPALNWYMTREDVDVMANVLAHADVVITPGSTMALEAAIFDRPTIIPIFHPYQSDEARAYFQGRLLQRHFKRIKELDLIPFAENEGEFLAFINRGLRYADWYRQQRQQIVRDYVGFTDGCSTKRLAEFCLRDFQGNWPTNGANARCRPAPIEMTRTATHVLES